MNEAKVKDKMPPKTKNTGTAAIIKIIKLIRQHIKLMNGVKAIDKMPPKTKNNHGTELQK